MTVSRDDAEPVRVDSAAIAERIGPAQAVPAARVAAEARAGGGVETRRTTLPYAGGWMRVMAGVVPSLGIFGYKEFHLSQDNSVRYAVHLFELATGRPLGVVDAALVTTLRTAASAAVAGEHFFGHGTSVRLGVVGTGAEALAGVHALASLLRISSVSVTSRRPENREKFARTVQAETGVPVEAVDSAVRAADGADVVYVATNSGGAVVVASDELVSVPFVASIGSTLPSQRELHADVLTTADRVVVDTWDVLDESGDAIAAAAAGLRRDKVQLLGQFLSTATPSPVTGGRTLYKSIGSPEQDLVLAHVILEAARGDGFGHSMEPLSYVKHNL
jgi:ornithine cyclodeaminase/alanine dehydrogenase-like protein (mu-crystallin family)